MLLDKLIRVLIISPLFSLFLLIGMAYGSDGDMRLAYQNSLAEIGLKWEPETSSNAIVHNREKIAQPKSQLVAMGYAILPGYFIPAAFGHAYAEANFQAAVISSARLSGRIMWMYSFFDNFFIDNAAGSISGAAMSMFYIGLAMDFGGYLYDILHAPFAVAKYNRRFLSENNQPRISPFINIAKGGPCCGVEIHF